MGDTDQSISRFELTAIKYADFCIFENKQVKSEVFTAVTMENIVFWVIKSQFISHRRHITSRLQSPAG
jgi:hypothetical protein